MSRHKKELPFLPASFSIDGGVPVVYIGETGNPFKSIRVQLDEKTASKITNGQRLDIFIGWED